MAASVMQQRVIFNPKLLSDCICSMALLKKNHRNSAGKTETALCCYVRMGRRGLGGNPVGQWCLWHPCHENMPAVNHCPLTSIHAETGALHNPARRQLLLQKMLCFEFPKQTKETLSALCQPFTHGKCERPLSGASGLILTEWAL